MSEVALSWYKSFSKAEREALCKNYSKVKKGVYINIPNTSNYYIDTIIDLYNTLGANNKKYVLSQQKDRYSSRVYFVNSPNIIELSRWAAEHIDCKKTFYVREFGTKTVETLKFFFYRVDGYSRIATYRVSNNNIPNKNEFKTEKEAISNFNQYVDEANEKLEKVHEEINAVLKANGCDIDYMIQGDTHGIHEDYMYISTNVGGYNFTRRVVW